MRHHAVLFLGMLIGAASIGEAQRPRAGAATGARAAASSFFRISRITVHPYNTGHERTDTTGKILPPLQDPVDGFRPWAYKSDEQEFAVREGPVLVLVELEVTAPSTMEAWYNDRSQITVSVVQPNVKPMQTIGKNTVPLRRHVAMSATADNSGFSKPMRRSWLPFLFYVELSCEGSYEIRASISGAPNGPVVSQTKLEYPLWETCN